MFQIGVRPGRIELLTSFSGLAFESTCLNRARLKIDDVTFDVVCLEDWIQNKSIVSWRGLHGEGCSE